MSISFSGLASGLDTSSWVESLTALKRAKVETYQAEKENLLLSQQTLNSIKNFFNSFRSVIEKVTDTKFGVGSMDLFAQNLAVSSKANILTATANSEAQEGTYTINVNNLATNTQASSGFSQVTTQTISATATLGSTLTSLGVKAGKIGVTVNGIERNLKIGNDETIQSFIEKLNNIGAKASYNENSGVFSINLSTSDIRDIDNTGIVKALHLQGVNEGYTSNTLQTNKIETVYEQATLNTKLSELGANDGYLYFYNKGKKEELYINSNQTIGEFVNLLNNNGIEASFSKDGYLSITESDDYYIASSGATGLWGIFGWSGREPDKINSTTQTSKPLQYTSTLVEGTIANRNTLLKDIDGVTVNNGDTIIVKNSNNKTSTITLSNTSTIGNVLDGLNSAGMPASINSKGIVTISDGSIIGGTFDIAAALGLDVESSTSSVTSNAIYVRKTIAQDVTSTATVTYTGVRDAVASDLVSDFVDLYGGDDWIYIEGPNNGNYGDTCVDDDWTFQDLFDYLEHYRISATMNNGVISLENNGDFYLRSDIGIGMLLGIGTISTSSSSTVTTAVTKTSDTLYYTANVTATGDSNIADYLSADSFNTQIGNNVYGCLGTIVKPNGGGDNIFVANNHNGSTTAPTVRTFNDLFAKLSTYGITATMNNGVISLTSSNGAYVTGDLFNQLGIKAINTTVTCNFNYNTSESPVIYTVTTQETTTSYEPLTANSKITDWWKLPDDYTLRIKVFDTTKAEFNNGQISSAQLVRDFDFSIDFDTTFQNLIDDINNVFSSYGNIQATASWDGRSLKIEANSGNTRNYFVLDEYGSSYGFSNSLSNFKYQRRDSAIGLSPDVAYGIMNNNSTDDAAFQSVQLTYCVDEDTYYKKSVTGIEGISSSNSAMTENSRVLDWWVGTASDGSLYKLDSYVLKFNIYSQSGITITENMTFGDLINKINSTETFSASLIDSGNAKHLKITSIHNNINIIETDIFNANKNYGSNNTMAAGLYSISCTGSEIDLVYNNNQTIFPPNPAPNKEVTKTIDYNTTFGNLGINSNGTIKIVTTEGVTKYITVTSNMTIGDLDSRLSEYGISTEINNGTFYIAGTPNPYNYEEPNHITYISSNIVNALHLQNNGNQKTTYNLTVNTSSTQLITSNTKIAETTTTLKELGQSGNKTITANYNGSTLTIVLQDTMSIADALSTINRTFGSINIYADFYDGQIEFRGGNTQNAYITDFGGAFGMTGNGYKTNVQTSGSVINTKSNRLQKEETRTANWDTTMEELALEEGTGKFTVIDKNGSRHNIFIDSSDTIRDIREKLAMYDIALNCSSGKIILSGTNGAYIRSMSQSVANAFNIQSRENNYSYIGITYTTTDSILTSADRNMKIGDLYYKSPYMDYAMDNIYSDFDGKFYVENNGVRTLLDIKYTDTIEDLCNKFASVGVSCYINSQGQLQLNSDKGVYFYSENDFDNGWADLEALGIDQSQWKINTTYKSSSPVGVTNSSSITEGAQRDTKLSDLGVTTGEYLLYKDGVKHTLYVSSDDTLGDFMNSLRSFGIESSLVTNNNNTTIRLHAEGDSYIATSKAPDSSNIVDRLFDYTKSQTYTHSTQLGFDKTITTTENAAEDTRINDIYSNLSDLKNTDTLNITFNNENIKVDISEDETVGSLLDKLHSIGLEATLSDGKIMIQSGYDTVNISGLSNGSTKRLGLTYSSDLGGYAASNSAVTSTEVIVETRNNSVAKYADANTKLGLLNISNGNLTIYRNGVKAEIIVDSEQTFGNLQSKIAAKFGNDVQLSFEEGYLTISSNSGAEIMVGTTTDTSNFAAITGMHSDGKNSKSSRALYRVNNDSKVTTSGLFVRGQVTEGYFIVGNAKINIDNNTTLDDIISQINYNDDSNATAYWDSIDGKFVIKAKTTGAAMINIEAGSSNFTDIMGLTKNEDGKSKLNTDAQTLGQNARFTINGTNFTSTSNTVSSEVSRIEGVTINLKDISDGETVTLTIEKDKETAANAISDIVDAYNELIANVDKEVARGANLSSESTLKLIRNQIRSLMTSSIANKGSFKNLASIGISLAAASSGNIRTDNINELSFDKDKFIESFGADLSSLKSLLVGTDEQKGILTQVEDVLEQALGGVTGYFASAEKSYSKKISKLDEKITKTNKAADRYKTRLEAKFKSMDMLISKFQNQYSSFLGG